MEYRMRFNMMGVDVAARVLAVILVLLLQGYAMGAEGKPTGKPAYKPTTTPEPGTYPPGMDPTPPGALAPVAGTVTDTYVVRVTQVPQNAVDRAFAASAGFVWATPKALEANDQLRAVEPGPLTKSQLTYLLSEELASKSTVHDPSIARYRYLRWTSGPPQNGEVRIVWPSGNVRGMEGVQYVSDATPGVRISQIVSELANTPIEENRQLSRYEWAMQTLRDSPLHQRLIDADWRLQRFEVDKHWQIVRTSWTAALGANKLQLVLCHGERGILLEVSGSTEALSGTSHQ